MNYHFDLVLISSDDGCNERIHVEQFSDSPKRWPHKPWSFDLARGSGEISRWLDENEIELNDPLIVNGISYAKLKDVDDCALMRISLRFDS